MTDFDPHSVVDSLTEREREVVRLMVQRLSNREIAAQLHIETETARWYSKQIYSKLGVHSRAEAIERAAALGLDDGVGAEVAAKTTPVIGYNLPIPTTPFIGRERELTELFDLLSDDDVRLVTMLGPGGMGKTRLALEVAGQIASQTSHGQSFADGVFFVPLAALNSPANLISTLAEALGLHFFGGTDPHQHFLDYLRGQETLLILDNFEHLLDGTPLVGDMLRAAPGLKIVVTSRERLNLMEETLFRIAGMRLPERERQDDVLQHDAVQLFMQSARRVVPGFELSDDDLEAVVHICQLVGGMPLAILLAAAWVEMLPLAEIADEITHSLDFLATDMRNLPERLRSIRAVFERSWALLSDDERAVFKKLSVFRGGFTREAAQAVAGASLRDLTTLVNKSLVQPSPAGRYDVHELLRQYADDKLGETPEEQEQVLDLHCTYFAEFMQQREHDLWTSGSGEHEVIQEIENIRLAWHQAVLGEKYAEIYKIYLNLRTLYEYQGWWLEAAQSFAWAAEQLDDGTPTGQKGAMLGWLLCAQSFYDRRTGRVEAGKQMMLNGLSILRDLDAREQLAWCNLHLHSHGAKYSPEIIESYDEMTKLLTESLEYFKAVDDPRGISWTLLTLGNVNRDHEYYQQATDYLEQGLTIATQHDAVHDIGWAYTVLADCAIQRKAYSEARQHYQDFQLYAKDSGLRLSWYYERKGMVDYYLQDYQEARQSFCAALAIFADELYMASSVLEIVLWLARIQQQQGDMIQTTELATFVQTHPECIEETRDEANALLTESKVELPPDEFNAAVERGKMRDLEMVVADLLAECED